jgi:membrane associated rhomboid family serine protease
MLIIANVIVFIVTFLPDLSHPYWFYTLFGAFESPSINLISSRYGLVPGDVLNGTNLYTLFTSMFIHADLFHVGGNMLFLYVFGDNVEDTFGHLPYLVVYLLSGFGASVAHILAVVNTDALFIPTIGASGAISGVMGAYFVLYPRARIMTLVFFFWIAIVAIPAVVFLGLWFAFQFLYGSLLTGSGGGIAYWAHIGGFMAGIIFGIAGRGRRHKRVF